MPRSPARKRPIRRIRTHGKWLHMGPQVTDAVSGWPIPKRLTITQRGVPVARDYKDGSRDRPDSW